MMKMLSIFVLFLSVLSCTDPIIPVPPVDPPLKDTIWQQVNKIKFLNDYGSIIGTDYKVRYKNLFITDDDYKLSGVNILAYDMSTGKLEWEWRYEGKVSDHSRKLEVHNDNLIIDTGNGLINLHLPTRTVVWETLHNEHYRSNFMHVIGDHVYKSISKGSDNNIYTTTYYRWDIDNGTQEALFTLNRKENTFGAFFSGPTLYRDPRNGDTLMIVTNGWFGQPSPQNSPTDLLVYNLRTKKEVWKAEEYCKVVTAIVFKPIIHGDDVIVPGDWSIYSYDIATGVLNWRREFPDLGNFGCFNDTQSMLVGDRLYINPYTDDVMCLDAKTGDLIWRSNVSAYNSSPTMLYKDDMLIFTGFGKGSIIIVDAITGKLIHRERAHDDSSFTSNIVYNPELDLYGCQNFKYLYFFKINKPK